MFVTNLKDVPVGLNGTVTLKPGEINRHIDDNNCDLVERAERLKAHGLVSIVYEEGLTKTGIPGKVVKTLGLNESALNLKHVEEVATKKLEAVEKAAAKSKRTTKRKVETTDETPVEVE